MCVCVCVLDSPAVGCLAFEVTTAQQYILGDNQSVPQPGPYAMGIDYCGRILRFGSLTLEGS